MNMKTKNRNYLFSAVLMGIVMMMTACVANNDNAAAAGDPDTIQDFEVPEAEPTADAPMRWRWLLRELLMCLTLVILANARHW